MAMREGFKPAIWIVVAALFVALSGQAFASVINSGRGLPHTKSAYTTLQGRMTAGGNLRFWGGTGEYTNGDKEGETRIWVARSVGNMTYGFSKHGVVSLSPILYQDHIKNPASKFPGIHFFISSLAILRLKKNRIGLVLISACAFQRARNIM